MYVVICGGGKVGEYLARVMIGGKNQVAVIEQDRETAARLSVDLQGSCMIILGDGCDSKYQEDAGIRRADVFVAATGHDDNNLVSCEIAQRVFQVPRCVARVNSPKNMRIFRKMGIESISSTVLIANLIEEETMMGSMSAITSLTHGNVALTEISLPRLHQHSGVLRVKDIDMPEGSSIVAVSADADVEVATPDTVLRNGNKVIVIADSDTVDEARQAIREL